jgi:hypothetical protein
VGHRRLTDTRRGPRRRHECGRGIQGTKGFRWGEGEWPRVIFEAGPILGLLYLMLARLDHVRRRTGGACASAVPVCLLPLLLWGACASSLLSGQWGQTSIQGFGVFTLGLTLAPAGPHSAAPRRAGHRAIARWVRRQQAARRASA